MQALLPFYRGQVKCIFIDPPYNTRSAFEHCDDNLEHAQWLSMMLPRRRAVVMVATIQSFRIDDTDKRNVFGQIALQRDGLGMAGQLNALLN